MSAVSTTNCPVCGTPLQWLKQEGPMAGLKGHWDLIHRTQMTWLSLLNRLD